jgi:hypothetical protein
VLRNREIYRENVDFVSCRGFGQPNSPRKPTIWRPNSLLRQNREFALAKQGISDAEQGSLFLRAFSERKGPGFLDPALVEHFLSVSDGDGAERSTM